MDVDHSKEHVEGVSTPESAHHAHADLPKAKEKKKKIRPYHRIHAHRNPLSDSPME